MAVNSYQCTTNPLLIPEIVGLVMENVDRVPDLFNCARVNRMWMVPALKNLYQGSLNDMQFRTPGIELLNCLFVASPERFTRNMSLVKHLLLAPEYPARNCVGSCGRPICFDFIRVLRYRPQCGLLLRAQPRGLTSLMIPFEIMRLRLDLIADYLGKSPVEFLAINNYDCTRIVCYGGGEFPNLKALTVYISEDDPAIGGICRLLMIRDLEFVHIEEWHELDAFERFELSGRLIPHLRAQKNLKALVLSIRGCGSPLAEGEEEPLWPRLKALYIDRPDQEWFVQLPKFKDLQILNLLDLMNHEHINAAVAKCKHLRVLELPNLRLNATDENQVMETFLDIARGCPLLQKLSVDFLSGSWHGEVTKPLLSNLLRALPRLEVLKLGFPCRVYGTELEELAHHCPRLTFLELPSAELFISLSQMSRTLPLRYLEIMRFYQVWFKYPLPFIRGVNFHNLVTEWSRIFPKLRTEPCSNDIEYSPGILSGEEEYSIDHREELSFPDDDEHREDSEWHVIRAKLWQALGYGKIDDGVDDRLHYMWQTNLEIETIGWSVLPSKAFIHPVWHSSTPTKY